MTIAADIATLSQGIRDLAGTIAQLQQVLLPGVSGAPTDIAQLGTLVQEIDKALEVALAEQQGLVGIIGDLPETLREKASNWQERLETAISEARNELLDAISETMEGKVLEPVKAFAEETCGEIQAQLSEASDTLQEEVIGNARDVALAAIGELRQELYNVLQGFVDTLARGNEREATDREVIQAAVSQLQPAIDMLLDQFNRVKGLASTVGM